MGVIYMKILNFGSLNIDYVYSVDHFVQKGETDSEKFLSSANGNPCSISSTSVETAV